MPATPTPTDSIDNRSQRRRSVGPHARRGGPSAHVSSDIQSNEDKSKISLLGIPEGDVKITGGHFNGVGGNQFSLHLNLSEGHSERCQRQHYNPVSMASDEAGMDYERNADVENMGSHALPSDRMPNSIPIPDHEGSERSTPRVVQQVNEEPYTIYFRCLATRERGSPLWIPEPNKELPIEYQRNGLVIGDVGIITDQGCFDSLFNISLPPDHPLAINTDILPQNFSPLEIKPSHRLKSSKFKKGASLSSGSVSVTIDDLSGLTFESSASEGAILTLPSGSSSEDLRNQKILRDYLAVHLEEIYRCALIEHGREINNGDLRIVTGFDKTTTWGMAAFSNSTSQRKPSFRLEFRPKNQGCDEQTHSWKSSGTAEVKSGPDVEEVDALRMGEPSQQDAEYKNQTVFVRTQTPTLNPTIWNALLEESGAGELHLDDNSDTPSDSSSSPSGNSQSPGSDNSADEAGHKSATYRSKSYSLSSTNTLAMHPSNGINAMLLKLDPSAQMAITEDDIWISVLKDDDAVLPSTETLWGRILELYDAHLEDGVVFLTKLPAQAEVSPIHKEPAADAMGLLSLGRESNTILAKENRSKSRIETARHPSMVLKCQSNLAFDFKDKVVSAGAHYGSSSLERAGHSSIFEAIARITQQIAAPSGLYVGPQLYNSQPSMGMSQLPGDLPRGPMVPSVKGSIKVKPGPDLPRGPINSNVKGSSSSKPPVQTRSISGPPTHEGPATNNYYPNPPDSPTGVYYPPTSGYPHAPAGSYSIPVRSYPPPAGGYPPQVHPPAMSSNATPSGGGAPAIGGFVTRPRES